MFSFRKPWKKQRENQVNALKFLCFSNKPNKLKQTKSIFPKNLLNNLITDKLKEMVQVRNIIK